LGVDLSVAMFDMQKEDSGVSPVIGVILMVAVTVALVALVTVVVFDLGGDVSDSPDATVQLEQGTNETNDSITATLLRNENVDALYLAAEGASDPTDGSGARVANNSMTDAGDSVSLVDTVNFPFSDGDTFNIIAQMPDGSTEVLTSTTYEE
jgi:flagellin-like protein